MSQDVVLTVVIAIPSLVLAVWGVVLAFRYSHKVEVIFVEQGCLALYDDVAQGIDGLGVSYRGIPVSREHVLLRGCLANTGKRDITEAMTEEPLSLQLADGSRCLDCRVTSMSKGLQAAAELVAADRVTFRTGLFKTKELLLFDALVTVPPPNVAARGSPKPQRQKPGSLLRGALTWHHRIADAGRVPFKNLMTIGYGYPFEPGPAMSALMLSSLLMLLWVFSAGPSRQSDPGPGGSQGQPVQTAVTPSRPFDDVHGPDSDRWFDTTRDSLSHSASMTTPLNTPSTAPGSRPDTTRDRTSMTGGRLVLYILSCTAFAVSAGLTVRHLIRRRRYGWVLAAIAVLADGSE